MEKNYPQTGIKLTAEVMFIQLLTIVRLKYIVDLAYVFSTLI